MKPEELVESFWFWGQKILTIPITAMERIYWPYLLSAIFIALLVYLFQVKQTSKSPKGFFQYLFPKEIYTHPSAWVDFKFMLVNKLIKILCIAPFLFLYPIVSRMTQGGLGYFAQAPASGIMPTTELLIIYTILAALVLDLSAYMAHFLQHKVRFFWEFHKVHHSAQVLHPVTVYRVHPVDDMLAMFLATTLTGVLNGVFLFWFPSGLNPIKFWQLNVVILVFYLLGYNLRHSHVWLRYPSAASHILMSPAQHQIHHSKNPIHYDKNMGFMLSLWDWIFGTLHVPTDEEGEELEFGIAHGEEREFSGVWRLYTYPFRQVWKRLTKS